MGPWQVHSLRSGPDDFSTAHNLSGHVSYRVGGRSLALASLIGARPLVRQRARPVLAALAGLASATTVLQLRSGNYRVLVLGVAPRGELPKDATLGERAPLTSGCSGLAILAFLSTLEADAVIAARPRRERAPMQALLAGIRADGYALSFSANHPELNGIAAPLLDRDGYPLGSVAIAGPPVRLSEPALRQLGAPLIDACTRLAPRLATVLGPYSSERLSALDLKP